MLGARRSIFFAGIVSLVGPAMTSGAEYPVRHAELAPVEWSTIPDRAATLFYPGQSSYQWLRGPGYAADMAAIAAGAPCSACHTGKEPALGERIVAGGSLKPGPIPGKRGAIELRVQAAYDDRQLYLRLQWPTQQDRPGQVHDFLVVSAERVIGIICRREALKALLEIG